MRHKRTRTRRRAKAFLPVGQNKTHIRLGSWPESGGRDCEVAWLSIDYRSGVWLRGRDRMSACILEVDSIARPLASIVERRPLLPYCQSARKGTLDRHPKGSL